MTIKELLTHTYKVAKRKDDLWIGFGITDIEYKDRYERLRIVFGYYEQQDVLYEFLIDEVFFYMKMEENVIEEVIGPEIPLQPFINVYNKSKVLDFVKNQFMINYIYDKPEQFIHYQFTAQNMILNVVSRGEPVINIIDGDTA